MGHIWFLGMLSVRWQLYKKRCFTSIRYEAINIIFDGLQMERKGGEGGREGRERRERERGREREEKVKKSLVAVTVD